MSLGSRGNSPNNQRFGDFLGSRRYRSAQVASASESDSDPEPQQSGGVAQISRSVGVPESMAPRGHIQVGRRG